MKQIVWISIIIGLLYILFCIFIFLFQTNLIFFPSKKPFTIPKSANITEVYVTTEDNVKLNAWFVDNQSNKTAIFFHGNGGNISHNQQRLKMFEELGLNVILFDYRGYGKSEGNIQQENDLYKDADAIYDYALSRAWDPNNIILWWQSLGGAIAIHLAQHKNIYATIIESTFYSMSEVAHTRYWFVPTTFLLQFHFKNNEKIHNIVSPILIIHSIDDQMIDIWHGKRLFDQAKTHKIFLETHGSHNNGFKTSYKTYVSTIDTFLKKTTN